MFELISIVEDDFDSSTISSVALTEWLRTSGLAEKEHRHVLRDIDEMMAVKAEIDEPKFGRISFEGTYKTANNQDRRCWYLTIDDAIVLCSRYSYKIGFVLVEEIGRLRKRIRELEEENLRIMLEHTARLELENSKISFDNSMMARDLELLTFRELKWKELTASQVAQFIRANMYEIDSSESTFSPSVIDLNDILFKMGLIGYRTQFNQKRPNPA